MRSTLVVALALLASACSSTPSDEDNPFRPESFQPRGGEIQIYVNNLNFADATLMALHDGGRNRLGTVSGKSSGEFRLSWPSARDLRIQIDLLASDQFVTAPLSVGPGDRVSLTIESVLTRSHIIR